MYLRTGWSSQPVLTNGEHPLLRLDKVLWISEQWFSSSLGNQEQCQLPCVDSFLSCDVLAVFTVSWLVQLMEELRQVTANGSVVFTSQQSSSFNNLHTDASRMEKNFHRNPRYQSLHLFGPRMRAATTKRQRQQRHKFAYSTTKNSCFSHFARAFCSFHSRSRVINDMLSSVLPSIREIATWSLRGAVFKRHSTGHDYTVIWQW